MDFLFKLHPPKFLRYIYYRLYIFAMETKNSTPKTSVAITLAFTHILQLFFLTLVFLYAVNDKAILVSVFTGNSNVAIAIIALVFLYFCELFYHYKDKHLKYLAEFEMESKKEKNIGTFYLISYLTASFSLLYIGLIWLIPKISPYYN